ncbi:hypothetical protein HPB52_011960 [Rhipicephalus sanguineus]|uniref:Uncharacterized protein n=1 Tax=Rhipicephalus sanguineus TaxID=34632 RepID=A0A9D4YPH8_RHISA|nr:hypothetical protein HPB52_011960 [Rhipicephalus sanguineus]
MLDEADSGTERTHFPVNLELTTHDEAFYCGAHLMRRKENTRQAARSYQRLRARSLRKLQLQDLRDAHSRPRKMSQLRVQKRSCCGKTAGLLPQQKSATVRTRADARCLSRTAAGDPPDTSTLRRDASSQGRLVIARSHAPSPNAD